MSSIRVDAWTNVVSGYFLSGEQLLLAVLLLTTELVPVLLDHSSRRIVLEK